MSTRRKKIVVACATLLVCALITWFATFVSRSRALYEASKEGARGWRGAVYRADSEMGLAPIAGAHADEVLPPLPDVPSHIDSRGFRVPVDQSDDAPIVRPTVLALGCSVTYGSCVLAEETFAWKVAQGLGAACLNAGLCSGGAAHELILARRLIPQYEPDYVLVQYSPWLIERSSTPYAPSFTGAIPVPFFVAAASGAELHEPLFETLVFDVPTREYRSTARTFGDFLSFTLRVGVPLLAHDDTCIAWADLKQKLGRSSPIAAPDRIDEFVYGEIAALCREHGARLVVVALEEGSVPWTAPLAITSLGVPIAYGTNRLRAELPEVNRTTYNRAFLHTAGDPPVLVDRHPNAHAHALIADEILTVMRNAK
ncbi:MAG: hypothetical protein SGI72_18455 [Planctomycetota bacterium]|nr:hypothetical protein [Planctomycetota bacterium]